MRKHVFCLDSESLRYMALGDACVRILSIISVTDNDSLDAVIIPPSNENLIPLFRLCFGAKLMSFIPESHADASISRPTKLDWRYGCAAWDVFESVRWESGFFGKGYTIPMLGIIPCDAGAKSVMIYPSEKTDGNRVLNSSFWLDACDKFRTKGFKINHLGYRSENLSEFYAKAKFDAEFPASIDGLIACAGKSSLAFGGNTGPTWACLLSHIPQIVVESKKSPHGYWNFDRINTSLRKSIKIVQTIDASIT